MRTTVEKWYDADTPEVSVVVINFNRFDLTRECLAALWLNTIGHRYEIVVVDNGSVSDEVRKLANIGSHFRLIELPENRHFGEGCNIGADHSKGKYLVFLNNDAFVTRGWLTPLIGLLEDYSDAGAVGPRMVDPTGRLQEAGAFISETGSGLQVGRAAPPYHPREEFETRIVDYCSAACLALPKQLFAELGGFDPIYSPGYYENSDLCMKIAATNRFVYYCPEATVVHIQNATSKSLWGAEKLAQIVETNRQKFLSRWGDWLRARAENREIPLRIPQSSSASWSKRVLTTALRQLRGR